MLCVLVMNGRKHIAGPPSFYSKQKTALLKQSEEIHIEMLVLIILGYRIKSTLSGLLICVFYLFAVCMG